MTTHANLKTAFVIGASRVALEFQMRPAPAAHTHGALTVDLQPVPFDAVDVSFTGEMTDGGAGQINADLRRAAEAVGARDVVSICDLWDAWHLNGLRAGTRAQTAALASMPPPIGGDHYNAARTFLESRGLEPDPAGAALYPERGGYSYGSAWLHEVAPASDVYEQVRALFASVDGKRYGSAYAAPDDESEETDAPDAPDEADFDNESDIIDSRAVIARIEELRDHVNACDEAGAEPDADAAQELATLESLESDAEGYAADWRHGETLIRDSYFEAYAEQYAEDIGAVGRNARWPLAHIDWKAAAEELQADYTAVEFGNVTYWIR